jgi:hypothetical protein
VNGLRQRLLTVLFCALLSPGLAHADAGRTFKGELKFQGMYVDSSVDSLSNALGVGNHWDGTLDLRLMDNGQLGSGWSWDAAWVLDLRQGDDVTLDRRLQAYAPAFYVPAEKRNWWNLQHTFTNRDGQYGAHRIDRLILGYSSDHGIFKIGRQALTWGGGLVFHPMDLFNPFPPNATDTEYKPGADMLYSQWLFDDGSDIQGVVVPRRDPATNRLANNQSAAGLKWHGFFDAEQQTGYEMMLARNYNANLLGLNFNGPLGGATWSAEIIPTRLGDGSIHASWLANLQYAWSCFDRNCNGYLEYFHNSFGVGGSDNTFATLPTALNDRLARGELFTISRDYLALGLTAEWTPLLNIKPLLITNLDDSSGLLVVQAVRSLSNTVNLTLAVQSGLGPRGTEYGGLETAPGSGIYIKPERYLYARIDWYF